MMKRIGFGLILLLISTAARAQVVTTSPYFPRADQPVTITVDVTGTSLSGYAWNNTTAPVYIWTWIAEGCSSNCDAPTNVNPATDAQNAAKAMRISTNPDKYQITFTPTTFFNKPASELKKIGLKLKTRNWSDNKQTDRDRFITFSTGFDLAVASPTTFPVFKNTGEQLTITAYTSESAEITIKINDVQVAVNTNATSITYNHTIAEAGTANVVVTANNGTTIKTTSFQYVVRTPTINASRPTGIVDGINYDADPTKVTLSLWAPGKTSAYVFGDFSDWKVNSNYQMKKDGEHFWIELTGLTPGMEYGYQYLVNETLKLADPYADKILDPDDQYIPSTTYPNLKPFPQSALNDDWYYNRVAVFQTGQTDYEWQALNYTPPATKDMVIYELHIRDFFDSNHRNYQTLIDTIGYFKRLGVNAIQLMPIMEFGGNDSWGYNPTFMFAPDKYYGTKNKLKEFIDVCHQNGIAVILDIAMNHQDTPNPYILMDFNFTTFTPNPTNKWFNVSATHPFSVFFDMNHESAYTKKYLDTVNYYWLNEYKIDGFRFDLSKGFTQTSNPDNVSAWSAYDQSRINLLKRMADKIREHSPDAILILEHLGDNSEETVLANYGFLLWGNLNYAFSQNSMGYSSESSINWSSYKNRGWTNPNLIVYMESHDEERMMYRNLQSGRTSGFYNIRSVPTALDRVKAAASVFFLTPGPKMIWQFGELGYDVSIDFNGRVGAKPVKWEYYDDEGRKKLFDTFSELIHLKRSYDIFSTTNFTIAGDATLTKQLTLKNSPYTTTPANADQMNAHVIANFDVVQKNISVSFPHSGKWYDFFSGGTELTVASTPVSLSLLPGEFRVFTDVKLEEPIEELNPFVRPAKPTLDALAEVPGGISLTWTDHAELEAAFSIYRRLEGGEFTKVGQVEANTATFVDNTSLQPNTSYEYYVTADNSFGSAASNVSGIETTILVVGNEENVSGAIHAAPNPFVNSLRFETSLVVSHVTLIAPGGQRLTLNQSGTGWNTTQVAPGFYIAEIVTSEDIYKIKVVKHQ